MNELTISARYIPAGTHVVRTTYADGNTCLMAVSDIGEPYGILSVNIPESEIHEDCVWIKDWSENEGILEALVDSKLVESLPVTRPCGYTSAQLVKLTL
jgi:hypothetical protein